MGVTGSHTVHLLPVPHVCKALLGHIWSLNISPWLLLGTSRVMCLQESLAGRLSASMWRCSCTCKVCSGDGYHWRAAFLPCHRSHAGGWLCAKSIPAGLMTRVNQVGRETWMRKTSLWNILKLHYIEPTIKLLQLTAKPYLNDWVPHGLLSLWRKGLGSAFTYGVHGIVCLKYILVDGTHVCLCD